MAITEFIPEVWSAQLLSSLKKAHVFAGLCNRNYEGEIAQSGDTVKITTISRPTVAAYTANTTTITPETLTDAQKSLVINQSYYFAFEVDDINARQAVNGGALMSEAAIEAAYALADTTDIFLAATIAAGAASANVVSATSRATSDLCLSGLVDAKTLLDNANVPKQGRWVVIPPWVEAKLLLQDEYLMVDSLSGGTSLGNGQVGRIMGFEVYLSNNCLLSDTVNDNMVYFGHPSAITFAEQITKVEAYRPQSAFSDALKGLHLYGAKVIRPAALGTSVYSQT